LASVHALTPTCSYERISILEQFRSVMPTPAQSQEIQPAGPAAEDDLQARMLAMLQRMEERQQQTEQRLVDMAASQNASIDERLNARLTAPLPPAAPVSGVRRRLVSFFGVGAGEPDEAAAPAAVDLSDDADAAAAHPPAPPAAPQRRTQRVPASQRGVWSW
jgi:hypothetical protein